MVCIHNLTLGVTWVESHLATPLPIGVQSEKVPKKRREELLNNAWTLGVRSTNPSNIYFGSKYVRMFVCIYWKTTSLGRRFLSDLRTVSQKRNYCILKS